MWTLVAKLTIEVAKIATRFRNFLSSESKHLEHTLYN